MAKKPVLKTKLLKQVRKEIVLKKTEICDIPMLVIDNLCQKSTNPRQTIVAGDVNMAKLIVRAYRLESARQILKRKPKYTQPAIKNPNEIIV